MAKRLAEVAFAPLQLTREASLNRTRLADLPGADARLSGRRAFEVLRLEALQRLAAEHGIQEAERSAVPRRVSEALRSSDLAQIAPARQVVAEFGQRLGHLVATLRLGGDDVISLRTDARQQRFGGDEIASPWRMAYRRHWRTVDRIWLGGGIAAALGADLLQAARAEAQRLGVDSSTLDLAAHADVLSLIGAARLRTTPAARAIVLDFGYSSVKRGIVQFQGDVLQHLGVLPRLSLPRPGLESQSTGEEVTQAIVEVIRATVQDAQGCQPGAIDSQVVLSLATYLRAGRPTATQELYDRLSDVDFDQLSADLERATGRPLFVRLVHDGTAAAAALPDNEPAGIVVLGTSLGAGFTVPDQRRLPIAADLQVAFRHDQDRV